MQGFIVFDFANEYAEARKQLAQWLNEGKIKRKETIIKGGLKNYEAAFDYLFEGKNIGKSSSLRCLGNTKLIYAQENCYSRPKHPRRHPNSKEALQQRKVFFRDHGA